MDPGLIIAHTIPNKENLYVKLPLEIPILGLDCTGGGPCGIDSIRDSVSILGYVLNAREEAVRYQEWHDRYVGPVEARISEIPQRERVRVYLESTSDTI